MLNSTVTNHVDQQRGYQQEGVESWRIREFLRMNPPSFCSLRTTEDPVNFLKELKKVFDAMHVIDVERLELVAYQLKNVVRTWFDQWKEGS